MPIHGTYHAWELRKITSYDSSTGDVVFSSPQGDYQENYHQYKHTYCVERNGCYKFIINDSFGDGMYGDNGAGFEVLCDDNVVSKSNGNFGWIYESNLFGDGCPSMTPSISAAPSLPPSITMTPSIS